MRSGRDRESGRVAGWCRWVVGISIACWMLGNGAAGSAAADIDPVEQGHFNAASKAFQDLSYDRAERDFAEFVRNWPTSSLKLEAVLRQAQSRYFQTNSAGAMELLTVHLPQAGRLVDQFQFWLAEAQFQAGRFDAAASTYALLARDFPKSAHFLAAAQNEALARYRLGQFPRVVELLRTADSAFQRAARAAPDHELVARGYLLLAETLLGLQEHAASEAALAVLLQKRVNPEMDWRRRFLRERLLLATGGAEVALKEIRRLHELAAALPQPGYQAESFALEATLLERAGRLEAAALVYTNNLAGRTPPEFKRQALFKIIELNLAQEKLDQTIAQLESFSAQHPQDSALDLAQLTLGELRLKQADALTPNPTNSPVRAQLLLTALTNFNRVLTGHTNSPLLGRTHFQRGWCLWHQGRETETAADFSAAVRLLPDSEDQAIARFKLGEAQMLQRDFTNAIQSFTLLLDRYAAVTRVKDSLFDQALYQILRAAVTVGNLPVAEDAVAKILAWYPDSFFSDRSLMMLGQARIHRGRPVEARADFLQLLGRFPGSALAPQVQLALARTFQQEGDWRGATTAFDNWVRLFPTNPELANVEYERAWVNYQAGNTTNTLRLFTNFVTRFPTNANAPIAQLWVGDYFLNLGLFDKAEENYQRLFQNTNWHVADLKYQARLSAGRAAFYRDGFKDATNYFIALINDEACPAALVAEAFFAHGDTLYKAGQQGFWPIDAYGDAINAFSRITNSFPTNRLASLALGRIGDSHLQLAARDPKRFDMAAEAYGKAIQWPGASAVARSLAEVALGQIREKQGRPKDAFEHYFNVFYEKNLQPDERPDPNAIKEAGLAIARLREEQQQWPEALQVYQRLIELLPSLRTMLEQRIERARKQAN